MANGNVIVSDVAGNGYFINPDTGMSEVQYKTLGDNRAKIPVIVSGDGKIAIVTSSRRTDFLDSAGNAMARYSSQGLSRLEALIQSKEDAIVRKIGNLSPKGKNLVELQARRLGGAQIISLKYMRVRRNLDTIPNLSRYLQQNAGFNRTEAEQLVQAMKEVGTLEIERNRLISLRGIGYGETAPLKIDDKRTAIIDNGGLTLLKLNKIESIERTVVQVECPNENLSKDIDNASRNNNLKDTGESAIEGSSGGGTISPQ